MGRRYRSRLGIRFTLLLVLIFLVGIGLSGAALYRQLQIMGQSWVSSNGLLLLHAMNSVRSYTANHVNPLVSPMMKDGKTFLPESVPAFSARSVFSDIGVGLPDKYIYKEAALNPTVPADLADAWETDLVVSFRQDRNLQELSGFRTLNGQLMFYSARPMVITSQACLQCHTTPELAPPAMVARYGPISGFGWKLNDVIAAQIVYAPATEVYRRGMQTWLSVMGIIIAAFAIAVFALNIALRKSVLSPISEMAALAEDISERDIDEHAPDRLDDVVTRPDELGQMARVFQRMAHEIYAREQSLKQQVEELRMEIDEVKKARQVSELVESSTFQDLQAKARAMRQQHQGKPNSSEEKNPDTEPPKA